MAGEITQWVNEEAYIVTSAELDSKQQEMLKKVLEYEKTFTLYMDEEEAYTKFCRTLHDFAKIIEKAYEFWQDYQDYLWKIPGTGEFSKKWLG